MCVCVFTVYHPSPDTSPQRYSSVIIDIIPVGKSDIFLKIYILFFTAYVSIESAANHEKIINNAKKM